MTSRRRATPPHGRRRPTLAGLPRALALPGTWIPSLHTHSYTRFEWVDMELWTHGLLASLLALCYISHNTKYDQCRTEYTITAAIS
jgi:hypothetical protein